LELNRWLPGIVTGWLIGVIILAGRKAGGFLVLGRLRRRGVSVPDDAMLTLFDQACRRIGVDPHRICLRISSLVQVPMTMGWLRPIVLFPAALLSGLSTREIELLLAHELAHIRRYDYLVNLLQSVVETLFFYHPVTWWISRRMRQERENCCDDLVAAGSTEILAYAHVLVRLESLRPSGASLATAANGGSLLQRIQRLSGEPVPAPGTGLPVLLAVLAILGLFSAVSLVNAQTAPADPTSSTNAAPPTDGAPSVAATPATTNAPPVAVVTPASTNATTAATAPAVPAGQTIYYQDNFARAGEFDGSSPDVKNTGNAKWTVSSGPGAYTTNRIGVSDANAVYDAAYLPVNGASGVTLDGKQNFTLTATLAPDTSNNWMGISLTTTPLTSGQNIFGGALVALTVSNGCAMAFQGQTNIKYDPFGDAAAPPYVISLSYHAKSGTITYSLAGQVIATQPNVTPDQIAALATVALGNGTAGPTAMITNFTLSVGGSD